MVLSAVLVISAVVSKKRQAVLLVSALQAYPAVATVASSNGSKRGKHVPRPTFTLMTLSLPFLCRSEVPLPRAVTYCPVSVLILRLAPWELFKGKSWWFVRCLDRNSSGIAGSLIAEPELVNSGVRLERPFRMQS